MLKHTLFTWLFTCVTGTLILCLCFAVSEMSTNEMEIIAMVALGITLVASIPSMVIYGILLQSLSQRMPLPQLKLIGSGYAILATAVSCVGAFGIVTHEHFGKESSVFLLAALPFALCFAAAVWIIPMPVTIRTDERLEEPGEERLLPVAAPMAYYIVIALAGIMLLYNFYQLFFSGFRIDDRKMVPHFILFFLNTGFAIAALILFIRWKSAGWKMMVVLGAAGIATAAYSSVTTIRLLMDHSGILAGFMASIVFFFFMDVMSLSLLHRIDLRGRFGTSMKDFWVWILVGLGFAVLRIGAAKVVYGM